MKSNLCIQVLIGACIVAAAAALDGTEIILWQHVEGSSYNKGVAVYNRGDEEVDLAANKYAIWVAHNGKVRVHARPVDKLVADCYLLAFVLVSTVAG